MLNRTRLPANLPCHMYNLWLVSCSFLFSMELHAGEGGLGLRCRWSWLWCPFNCFPLRFSNGSDLCKMKIALPPQAFVLFKNVFLLLDPQGDHVLWYDCEYDGIDDDGKISLKGLDQTFCKPVSSTACAAKYGSLWSGVVFEKGVIFHEFDFETSDLELEVSNMHRLRGYQLWHSLWQLPIVPTAFNQSRITSVILRDKEKGISCFQGFLI